MEKNIWHSAKEKPTVGKKVLLIKKSGIVKLVTPYDGDDYYLDSTWIKFSKQKEWAYIEDILSFTYSVTKTGDQKPVSEKLKDACEQLAENARKHKVETSSPFFSQTDYIQGVIDGAQWHKQQMMSKAIDGVVTFDYYDSGDKTYGCVAHDSFCLEDFSLKDRDKVKVIVIKED